MYVYIALDIVINLMYLHMYMYVQYMLSNHTLRLNMHMHVSCVQLKNFIKRASFDPVIDENYFARAQEKDKDDILPNPTARYILAFYVTGFILVLVIAIVLLLIYPVSYTHLTLPTIYSV